MPGTAGPLVQQKVKIPMVMQRLILVVLLGTAAIVALSHGAYAFQQQPPIVRQVIPTGWMCAGIGQSPAPPPPINQPQDVVSPSPVNLPADGVGATPIPKNGPSRETDRAFALGRFAKFAPAKRSAGKGTGTALAWEPAILGRARSGYSGEAQSTLLEAVREGRASKPWNCNARPLMVLFYDPSREADATFPADFDKSSALVQAARFFQLRRVSVNSIQKPELRAQVNDLKVLILDGAGDLVAELSRPRPQDLYCALDDVIAKDFDLHPAQSLARLDAIESERALLEARVRKLEASEVDAKGRRNPVNRENLAEARMALLKLRMEEESILTPRPKTR